jgi:catechol 2,3-dioxygenase-like lactoylglutathione lyase family enzyme
MLDHMTFRVADIARTRAFYVAALAPLGYAVHYEATHGDELVLGLGAGGRDNGAPGLRPHYHPHYYGAFVIDSDGNNVEAVCHEAA